MVLVLHEPIELSRRYAKNDFHIAAPVTLIFNLLTSKFLCQLVLTWVASRQSLNVAWGSVFKLSLVQMTRTSGPYVRPGRTGRLRLALTVPAGPTDGRTVYNALCGLIAVGRIMSHSDARRMTRRSVLN